MSTRQLIVGYTETLGRLGEIGRHYDDRQAKHPEELIKAELKLLYIDGSRENRFAYSKGDLDQAVGAIARKAQRTAVLRLSVDWHIGRDYWGSTHYIAQ